MRQLPSLFHMISLCYQRRRLRCSHVLQCLMACTRAHAANACQVGAHIDGLGPGSKGCMLPSSMGSAGFMLQNQRQNVQQQANPAGLPRLLHGIR